MHTHSQIQNVVLNCVQSTYETHTHTVPHTLASLRCMKYTKSVAYFSALRSSLLCLHLLAPVSWVYSAVALACFCKHQLAQ